MTFVSAVYEVLYPVVWIQISGTYVGEYVAGEKDTKIRKTVSRQWVCSLVGLIRHVFWGTDSTSTLQKRSRKMYVCMHPPTHTHTHTYTPIRQWDCSGFFHLRNSLRIECPPSLLCTWKWLFILSSVFQAFCSLLWCGSVTVLISCVHSNKAPQL